MPVRLSSSVRGIGLAVSVRTSTPAVICLIASLWLTPKRCSSSTTSSPSFLNVTSAARSAVRADDEIDGTVRQPVDDRAGLGRGEEAREHLDAHRVGGVALGEGLEVLLGEQRRRHEHRRLVAVLDRLEGRPHSHLGLAETDVPAHQPVHRDGPLHVRFTSAMAVSWSGVSG